MPRSPQKLVSRQYTAPWDKVTDNWNKTKILRRSELTARKTTLVADVIKEWPIVKHPNAHGLIYNDLKDMNLTNAEITSSLATVCLILLKLSRKNFL